MKATDLDSNPFYRVLNSKYRTRFEKAQQSTWTVLIPRATSLKHVTLDSKVVGYHILRPSPLFAEHYNCTDIDNSETLIEWDGQSDSIQILTGFNSAPKSVRILAQELAYNKDFQPYRLLVISEPVHTPSSRSRSRSIAMTTLSDSSNPPPCYQQSKEYLRTVAANAGAIRIIDEKIDHFNRNYQILPRYIDDTVLKLRHIFETSAKILEDSYKIPQSDERLHACIENYIAGMAHQKVFSAIRAFYKQQDLSLARRLDILRENDVTAEMLGVTDEVFYCDLPKAIVELASLDSKYTPLDKLWCLTNTVQSLQQEVEDHVISSGIALQFGEDLPALTSDILIPLLVLVIIRARVSHLESNLFYVQTFCDSSNGICSFALCTFQAAKQFIDSFNISSIQTSPQIPKKELSLVDLMEVTASLNEVSGPDQSSSGIDRKLEQITKLIEAQTMDFHSKEEAHLRLLEEQSSGNNSSAEDTSLTSSFSPLSSLRRSLRGSKGS